MERMTKKTPKIKESKASEVKLEIAKYFHEKIEELESASRFQAQSAVIKRHFTSAEGCPDTVEKYEVHALTKQARAEELKEVANFIFEKLDQIK